MKRVSMILAAFLLVPLGIAGEGLAKGPKGGKGKHHFKMEMFKDLGLSEDQMKQIKELKKSMKGEARSGRELVRQEHDQLDALLASADASEESIRSQHKKVQELKSQEMDRHLEIALKIRAILTPEQRKSWGQKMQERKHKRHRGPPPPEDF